MKVNHVWIVEMKIDGRWEPTMGAASNRVHAQTVIADWRKHNPDDKFRLSKYVFATTV